MTGCSGEVGERTLPPPTPILSHPVTWSWRQVLKENTNKEVLALEKCHLVKGSERTA